MPMASTPTLSAPLLVDTALWLVAASLSTVISHREQPAATLEQLLADGAAQQACAHKGNVHQTGLPESSTLSALARGAIQRP
jgi:hypothetical protein